VEQGLAEAEEELAPSLSHIPPREALPLCLPRAELGRNVPGRVSLGLWFLPTGAVHRPWMNYSPA